MSWFESGRINAMRVVPHLSLAISASVGRWTFTTSSTSHGSPSVAPAFSYASSVNDDAAPAPRSTTTVLLAFASRPTVSGTKPTRVSPGMVSFGTPIFTASCRGDQLLETRTDFLCEPLHRDRVVRIGEARDEAAHADIPERLELCRDLIGVPDDRVRRIHAVVVRADVVEHLTSVLGVITHADPLTAPRLDRVRVSPDLGAVLPEDLDLSLHRLWWPEAVPHVGVLRRRAQRLLFAAAADHDRQPLLHRPRVQHRVLELVVLAFVRHALAVEERARDLCSLCEAARALARRPEVDAVGLVLGLIPRCANAEDRATVR